MNNGKRFTLLMNVARAAHKVTPIFSGKQQRLLSVQALIKADKKLRDYENNAVANSVMGMDRGEKL